MRTRPSLDGNVLTVPVPNEAHAYVSVTLEKAMKRGGWMDVMLELPRKPRSTGPGSQSALFHALVAQLAMRLEISPELAKRYVKVRACEHGYPYEVINDGTKKVVEPRSEARASVEEESILIETCHAVAAERGWALFVR